MRFQDISPISKEDAMQAFSSDDESKICYSMIAVAFYEQDWKWAQDKCLEFLEDKNIKFSSLAATCLGHIARVHGKLEKDRVVQALTAHLEDPGIAGSVGDAIDDITMFVK